MALVSLKVPREGDDLEALGEDYGYGARLDLNGEQLEALGITKMLPAGATVTFRAVSRVVRSTTSDEGRGPENYAWLQVTDMEIVSMGKPTNAADKLYGEEASEA